MVRDLEAADQEVLQEVATQCDSCTGTVVDGVLRRPVPHQTTRGGLKLTSSSLIRINLKVGDWARGLHQTRGPEGSIGIRPVPRAAKRSSEVRSLDRSS